MLVVCNGAQKGGSTWIFQIAKALIPLQRIPGEYQDPTFKSSSIASTRITAFMTQSDWRVQDYCAKQHWVRRPSVRRLANDPDARFLNIIRDCRDVLVSRYFHDIRKKNISGDIGIKPYFLARGSDLIDRYCAHHFYWHRDALPEDVEPLLVSYEGLSWRFEEEVRRIGSFLGVPEADIRVDAAFEASRIDKLVVSSPFFRKGQVGDWKQQLDGDLCDALEQKLVQNGYLEFVDSLRKRGLTTAPGFIEGGWRKQL